MQDIPRLEIPLHTLIELTPKPDGTMAEERIPLDVKGANPEELAAHLKHRMNLQSGTYATPMTPFSPFEGGGGGSDSPFARVDSMGMGMDQLPTVSHIVIGQMNCGTTCTKRLLSVSVLHLAAGQFGTMWCCMLRHRLKPVT